MQLANDENLGRLLLEGRDQTRSDTMIHNVDVKAAGVPLALTQQRNHLTRRALLFSNS